MYLYYGIPALWMRRFIAYDARPGSSIDGFYLGGFLIDFFFWLGISFVLVYAIRWTYSTRKRIS